MEISKLPPENAINYFKMNKIWASILALLYVEWKFKSHRQMISKAFRKITKNKIGKNIFLENICATLSH